MFNKNIVILINVLTLIFITNIVSANNRISNKVYSGIEIGSKGVKFAIIELLDDQKTFNSYLSLYDSSINSNILNLSKQSSNETLEAVLFFYNKAKNQFKIAPNDIYITISSGILDEANKLNKLKLIEELKENLKIRAANEDINWDIISLEDEAEMSFNSLVPISAKQETILLNFGNSALKGGFYAENKEDFESFSLSYGGGSLVKKIIKVLPSGFNEQQFYTQLDEEMATLNKLELNNLFSTRVGYNEKRNIVCAGGIAWAINNLLMPNQSKYDFLQATTFQIDELRNLLKANFDKPYLQADIFTKKLKDPKTKALADAKLHQVLKVFDTKSLICGLELVNNLIVGFQQNQKAPYILITQHGSAGWIPGYIQKKTSTSNFTP